MEKNYLQYRINPEEEYYKNVGFAQAYVGEKGNDFYSGPQWFSESAKFLY